MMRCPFCQATETRVIDSRELGSGESIRRRRECQQCNRRFTTYERVEAVSLYVVKKDGRREEYDPRKLRNAVRISSAKRPVSEQQIDALVGDVERALADLGQREVPSGAIGEMVIERLRDLDPVAYIRFASVYREFADLDEMRAAIDRLVGSGQITAGRRRKTPPASEARTDTPVP